MTHGGPRRRLHVVDDESGLGAMLRRARLDRNVTQAELAEEFEVRPQTIGRWEQGVAPQSRFYLAIANFLGLPDETAVREILEGGSVEPSNPVRLQALAPDSPTESQRNVQQKMTEDVAQLREAFVDRIKHGQLTREESALFQQFLDLARHKT